MSVRSLEDKIVAAGGDPLEMMRQSQIGAYVFPLPGEFTNWRDEQHSWRETAVLFDQSHHMTDLYVEGPDALRLLSDIGVNSFKNFVPNRAKQYVACNYDGQMIGDCICFYLAENKVLLIGRPTVQNWVEFHAKTGKYDVTTLKDVRNVENNGRRLTFRYQVQGPNAAEILERVHGGPLPLIKFFHMGEITIAGHPVRALKHGMSGEPGLELWGPAEFGPEVHAALMEAGKDLGLKAAGGRAYATSMLENGWIPSPMPAIYSGEAMKPYREYLPAKGFEAMASLGGSFVSSRIEDYYLTPWDIGYGNFVKFDHDFIGRDALERLSGQPHRKKVTLVWKNEDVIAVLASQFNRDKRGKYLEWPASNYATLPYDKVLDAKGDMVGLSTYSGYNANLAEWVSLAMVDDAHAALGTEVTLIWGEEDGGSSKPVVERHVQMPIRATVAPAPYNATAMGAYREAIGHAVPA
ncbi:aminomethyltransferase family protein [Novosphingobium sp. FSW06-99]|uniref:vanillate/3-O-methylgallate O-demethylase n=1 Tax=Novosphingobium sp. FSW06-99 TaxID=1739113 RepID=UPI00076C8634|nr:aminomethyltransferase family protein [Novosphingobium sp. FSW06-99]KUR79594.1 glycine cleavage system protein T [Novosphingobium sp. FSW06-99]